MTQEQTVADIVTQDIRTATVFKKFGIDFCCGGGKPVQEACDEKGADFENLMAELNLVLNTIQSDIDFQAMPLDELIDYIYEKHHKYLYENGLITAQFVDKVARVHGQRHPETMEIAKIFNEMLSELNHHMMKEENILFPYVKKLVAMGKGESTESQAQSIVNHPIRVMQMEHDIAGEMLKKLNELTSNYTPPEDACNTYRASFANLKELEDDIHFHIHLENNILFPKAIELESILSN